MLFLRLLGSSSPSGGNVGWHMCTITAPAVRRGQCQQHGRLLSLEMGRGERVQLLSEQRSELRAAAGGDAWPQAPGARGAQGWAEEPCAQL